MITKTIYIKVGIVGEVVAVITLEIALLFVPFGPIRSAVRNFKVETAIEKAGGKACIVCGAPAVPILYETELGKVVTVTDFCAAHAPQRFNSSDKLAMNSDFSLLLVFISAIFCVICAASGLGGLRAPDGELLNSKTLWEKYFSPPVWSLALYVFTYVIFFWLPSLRH